MKDAFNEENLRARSPQYSESKFLKFVRTKARAVGYALLSKAFLLYFVMKASGTPTTDKLLIAGALAYLVLPLDFIPDFIPVLGFSDDAAALTAAFRQIKHNITPEIEQQAREAARRLLPE